MNTLKPSYRLLIGEKERPLYSYEVSHSVFTPGGVCLLETEGEYKEGEPLTLFLGYEGKLVKVFNGYVEKTLRKGNRTLLYARNEHFRFLKERVSGTLRDVSPKEVLSLLTGGFLLSERSYAVRHHFVIWNKTKDEVVKEVIRAWNLREFVYYFDLEGRLHLHKVGEFKKAPAKVPDNFLIREEKHVLVLRLSPQLFVNQEVHINGKSFLSLSVLHKNGLTVFKC